MGDELRGRGDGGGAVGDRVRVVPIVEDDIRGKAAPGQRIDLAREAGGD